MKYYTKLASLAVLLITFTGLVQTANASGFAAPVQVANPDTSPVPVRVLGNASHKPFQTTVYIDQSTTIKVPAGKRLVIEHFAAIRPAEHSAPILTVRIITNVNGDFVYHYFSQPAITDTGWQFADKMIKLYADPATNVNVVYVGDQTGGMVMISGYLEDAN